MTIDEFHRKHGPMWARITNISSFSEGLVFVSLQHTQQIINLTDEEITRNAVVLLAELRGRLRMQAEIMGLATMEEPVSTPPLQEEYPNAVEEFYAETERLKNLNQKSV